MANVPGPFGRWNGGRFRGTLIDTVMNAVKAQYSEASLSGLSRGVKDNGWPKA